LIRRHVHLAFALAAILAVLSGCEGKQPSVSADPDQWSDPATHHVSFVTVAPGVNLEVLDWGGTGPPLVFLAGLGNTAHAFDDFAPRFLDSFHVVAITRRGFGASTHPDSGYDAATLAADISSVLESMGLDQVILAGHSIATVELTEMGTHYANQVRRLVYLESVCLVPGAASLVSQPPPAGLAEPVAPAGADTLTAFGYVSFVRRTRGVSIPEADIRARYLADGWNEELGKGFRSVIEATELPSCEGVQVPSLVVVSSRDAISQEEPWIRADTASWAAQLEVERRSAERIQLLLARLPEVIPGGRAETVHGGHHWVFTSHPDEVERLMRAFLR
jgi:pimeloyl-ACP methyl ester carboxylesterase